MKTMALTDVILLSLKHLRAASVSATDRPQSSALMMSIVTRQKLQRYNGERSEITDARQNDGDQLGRSGRPIAIVRQQSKSNKLLIAPAHDSDAFLKFLLTLGLNDTCT